MNKITEEREEIGLTQKEAEQQKTLVASLQHQLGQLAYTKSAVKPQAVSRKEPLEGTVFRRRLGWCIFCSPTMKQPPPSDGRTTNILVRKAKGGTFCTSKYLLSSNAGSLRS